MNKVFKVLIIIVSFIFITNVNAGYKEDLTASFNEFVLYYNTGDSLICDLIHDNQNLCKKLKKNSGNGVIKYEQIDIKDLGNNEYRLVALAEGNGIIYNSHWSLNKQYVTFEYNYVDNKYLLSDTNFFELSSIDMLTLSYNKIFVKIALIFLRTFIPVILVILIISIILKKKKRIKIALN